MHMQTTHTEIRQKQCPYCSLCFKTTSQLNQHTLTHTDAKNHECPDCGKRFTQRYNMLAHYRLHSGVSGRKYTCTICDSSFYRSTQLKCHYSNAHESVMSVRKINEMSEVA